MSEIESVRAVEILDSRGRPTLLASCQLADGSRGQASVPSGASTGAAEALELRDGDPKRHGGLGCLKAVSNINDEINRALAGANFAEQPALDSMLIDLDGTSNKARLGANAILGVSLAFCRAQAAQRQQPLYANLAQMADTHPFLPKPMINLFSGGAHAGGQVAIQDVQIIVPAAQSIRRALEVTSDVFRAAAELTLDRYGMRLLTADEGGLAPPFEIIRSDAAGRCRGDRKRRIPAGRGYRADRRCRRLAVSRRRILSPGWRRIVQRSNGR